MKKTVSEKKKFADDERRCVSFESIEKQGITLNNQKRVGEKRKEGEI